MPIRFASTLTGLAFLALSVAWPARAFDSNDDPRKPLTLQRLLITEFGNLIQSVRNMQSSVAAASDSLAHSRAAYWRCHPNCPHDVQEQFSRRLIAKDLWYLNLTLHSGPTGRTIETITRHAGSFDRGIYRECSRFFGRWRSAVAQAAGDVQGTPGYVNMFKLPKAIEASRDEYAKYSECRDAGEYRRGPFALSADNVPAVAKPGPAARHVLVCWPLHLTSNSEEMHPLPPNILFRYEGLKPAILQAVNDRAGAVRTAAARGLRPILRVGYAETSDPPISFEYAKEGMWWTCGQGRPELLSLERAGSWEAASAERKALICWPRHTWEDRPIHSGGRGTVDIAPAPEAASHYAAVRTRIIDALRSGSGEANRILEQGGVPRFVVGHHDRKNQPRLALDAVERIGALACHWTLERAELVHLPEWPGPRGRP
jgi:hypothetical protein